MTAVIGAPFGGRPKSIQETTGLRDLAGLVALMLVLTMVASTVSVAPPSFSVRTDSPAITSAESLAAGAATSSASEIVTFDGIPEGVTPLEWATIQSQIGAYETGAVGATANAVAAPAIVDRSLPSLAGAGVDALFTPGSAVVATGSASASVILTTDTIGVFDTTSVAATSDGTIVEYAHHPSITEWFFTVDSGIEHGYTIAAPVAVTPTFDITVGVLDATPSLLDSNTVLLERADAAPLYYRDLVAFDADLRELPSSMNVVDGSIILSVDATGAAYPITVDPIITEDQKIEGPGAGDAIEAEFGKSAAADGDTVAVGVPWDDRFGFDNGAVYIYFNDPLDAPDQGWELQQIVGPSSPTYSEFGYDIDLVGDTLVVGAPEKETAVGPRAGVVYAFERTGTTWSETDVMHQCNLSASPCGQVAEGAVNSFANDLFGRSVALTSDEQTIVIGVPGATGGGTAYLYHRWPVAAGPISAGEWATDNTNILQPSVAIPSNSRFGAAVAIDALGEDIIVGAPGAPSPTAGVTGGNAWRFARSGGVIQTPVELDNGDAAGGDYGAAVAVNKRPDGDTIILVSQPMVSKELGEPPAAGQNKLVFWKFSPASSTPTIRTTITGNPGVQWRYGYDLDADTSGFAVGVPSYLGNDRGGVLTVPWVDATDLTGTSGVHFTAGASGDLMGSAVAISGDVIVGGAPFRDTLATNAGGARVASRTAAFTEVGLDPEPLAGGLFGTAVSIDGNVMAVGAPDALGPQGPEGAAYIFTRATSTAPWILDATIANPDGFALGEWGGAVAVRNGRVAVIDPQNDEDSNPLLRVYEDLGAGWVQIWSPETLSQLGNFPPVTASMVWQDDVTLIIGEPGASPEPDTGRVSQVRWNGASWTTTVLPTPPLGNNDQLGYSVDVGTNAAGDSIIVAGAPGWDSLTETDVGALLIWIDDGGTIATPQIVENATGWVDGSRMGTSVASSGGVVAVAGFGDGLAGTDLLVNILEQNPLAATLNYFITDSFSNPLVAAVSSGPNDYIELLGHNLFVGRPGGGGQVGLFRDVDGTGIAAAPVDRFQPSGRQPGDAIGSAIGFSGSTLAIGAPGDDPGAVYGINDVALTHNWIGHLRPSPSNPGLWEDPASWDTGLVPGPDDTAIIPDGNVQIQTLEEVAAIIVGVNAWVFITDAGGTGTFTLNGGPSGIASRVEGLLENSSISTLNIEADLEISGEVTTAFGDTVNINAANNIDITGTGQWSHQGILNKTGPGVVTFADTLEITSGGGSQTNIDGGELNFAGQPSMAGDFAMAPGATLGFPDGVDFAPGSTLDLKIAGPSSSPANYSRLVTQGAPLSTDLSNLDISIGLSGYTPVPGDDFLVAQCGGGGCDLAASLTIDPLLEAIVDATSIRAVAPSALPLSGSISGDWAVVGDPSAGVAYVMRNIAGTWTDVQTIPGGGLASYGAAVAIELPWISIGAPDADTVEYWVMDAPGVFTFSRTETGDAGSRFGASVDISSVWGAVGAPLADVGGTDSGSVIVHRFPNFTPTRFDGAAAGDQFGLSVALSSDRLWVGSPFADSGGLTDNGRVDRFLGTATIPNYTVEAASPIDNGQFGIALDANDSVVAVKSAGSADLELVDLSFGTRAVLPGTSSGFGQEVALSGDLLAVNDQGSGQGEAFSDNGDTTPFSNVNYTSVGTTAGQFVDVDADGGTILWVDEPTGPITAGTDVATFTRPPQNAPANKILPDFGGSGDWFGQSVAIDGDTMVVLSRYREAVLNEPGALYVFNRAEGEWSLSQVIDDGNFARRAIAIEGDVITVGVVNEVRIFERTGGTFIESAPITGLPAEVLSLDIEGTTLAVGVYAGGPGEARLYFDGPAGWAAGTHQVLTPTTVPAAADTYGWSIGLSPSNVVVGAPGVWAALSPGAGYADVWTRPAGLPSANATFSHRLTGTGTDTFGASVAVGGDRIAIGAPFDGTAEGVAYVYNTTSSTPLAELRIPTLVINQKFGEHVEIDGDILVVAGEQGQVESYSLLTSVPTPIQSDDDSDSESATLLANTFGDALALSGGTAVLGHTFEDQQGELAGAVYTYEIAPVLAPDDPSLTFSIGLQPGETPPEIGGGIGIPIASLGSTAALIEDNADNESSVGSTGFGAAGVAGSALGQISLADTPFSSIATSLPELAGLPLISIDIDLPGGWRAILAANPAYVDIPLVNLNVGEVFGDPLLAGAIGAIPFSSIEVNGTPFSSIPFSSIAMGEVPLDQIPLDATRTTPGDIAADWCAVLAGTPAECGANNALDGGATLMSVSLSGVPFSSIPFSSIPFSSIPFEEAPFSSIGLGDVNLAATPFSSIPFSSIPFSSIELADSPFSSIPFSSIPFSSIPFSSIPFSSIGVGTTPFSSIPFSSIPFSSIDVNGVPFSSIPFSSIAMADVAVADIPLDPDRTSEVQIAEDWCSLLGEFDIDCNNLNLAQTTITDVGVRGVPFSSIPFSSIPFSSITFDSIPFSSIPFSSIPFSSIPLGSTDLDAIDLSGTPFSSIPFSSIGPNPAPFSSIPFSSIDVEGSPFSSILLRDTGTTAAPFSSIPFSSIPFSSIPFSSIPFSSIPFSSIGPVAAPFSSIALADVDILSSPFSSIPFSSIPFSSISTFVDCTLVDCENATLGEAVLAGAVLPTATMGDLEPYLEGYRLPDLTNYLNSATPEEIHQLVLDWATAENVTLATLTDLGDLTLGDLPSLDPLFRQTVLGDIVSGLNTVTFLDLALALNAPLSADPAADLEAAIDIHADGANLTIGSMLTFGDVTFGEMLPALSGGQLGDLGAFLAFVHMADLGLDEGDLVIALGSASGSGPGGSWTVIDAINDSTLNLGDILLVDLLGSPEWGAATVRDLIEALPDDEVAGFTLADLLLGMLPEGALPWGVAFDNISASDIPGVMPSIGMRAEVTLTGARNRTIKVSAQLPPDAAYVPGSSSIFPALGGNLEPLVVNGRLVWTLSGIAPGVDDATPGETYALDFEVQPTVSVGSSVVHADGRIVGTNATVAATAILQVVEAFEPNDIPPGIPALEDTVYLVNISTDTDIDLFYVDIMEGDSIAVNLGGLPADFDIVLYSDTTATGLSTALTQTADNDPIVPVLDPDADGTEVVPDQSFRRLDQEYANIALVEISNSSGLEEETIIAERLPAGRYIIQVHGHDGVTSPDPAVLQIQVEGPEGAPPCVARGFVDSKTAGTAPDLLTLPADLDTVILVNEQRFEEMYGLTGRTMVTGSLNDLVASMTGDPEISQMGLSGVVVPVDGYATVRAAYAALDLPANVKDACNPDTANAVVSTIVSDVLDPIRAIRDIENIVLIGSDDLLPMARLHDATVVANEYDYRNELGGRNAFTGSFWSSTFLSDDPYGETAALPFGDRFIYLPDAALGRVLEEPRQIKDYIDQFIFFDGLLAAETGLVAGYDFLEDGSEAIADELTGPIAPADLDRDLADGIDDLTGLPWTATDIGDRLLTPDGLGDTNGPDIVSFNAHFDHYRALPAAGDQVAGFNDNFEVSEINALPAADGLLDGTIIFSMGCHSGLNVPDTSVGLTGELNDWAQAFIDQQAVYVGNTGFGYGDTETVGYTERLLQLFARNLVTPLALDELDPNAITTIGQAMQYAKQEAYAELVDVSVYHEKAIQESTLYGLPFFRVGLPAVALPAAPDNEPFIDPLTGEGAVIFLADADNIPNLVGTETYFSNLDDNGDPATITLPGRPIQPAISLDVTDVDPLDSTMVETEARGAIILDMTSSYVAVDPVVATPVFDESSKAPEPDRDNIVYPTTPQRVTMFQRPGGERHRLNLATGQYRGTEDAGVQRLDDDIDVIVYYSNDADRVAPSVLRVHSILDGAQLTITAEVDDHGGSGVDRVYVLATPSPGAAVAQWSGIDLIESPASSGRWVGAITFASVPDDIEFIVQAKDNGGNVGVSTNKAVSFGEEEIAPPAPITLSTTVTPGAGTTITNGYYNGPITVTAEADGLPIQYSLDGGALTNLTNAGVVVTGDGIHILEFVSADGQTITVVITIDTANPVVTIIQPQPGAVFAQGQVVAAVFSCQDPSASTCTGVVGGTTLENGDLLPTTSFGVHTLTVTGTDAVGNDASASVTYEVVGGLGFIVGQLENLIDNEPDKKVVKELEKVLKNVQKAVVHLGEDPAELSKALHDLEKAAKDVVDALDKGLSPAAHDDLLTTLGNIGRSRAFRAINNAVNRNGDQDDIDKALVHYDAGVLWLSTDVVEAMKEFQDAAKDAEKA